VARRLPGAGGRQLQPQQALSRAEAVRAATVTAAGSLQAPGGGGLAPGQIADFVVCDGDPFQEGTRVTRSGSAAGWSGRRPARKGLMGPPDLNLNRVRNAEVEVAAALTTQGNAMACQTRREKGAPS